MAVTEGNLGSSNGLGLGPHTNFMSVFETPWACVQASLRAFLPCPECNGQGMVLHQYFNTQAGVEDGDYDLCGECHGTGTEADLTAWVPGSEEAEEQSPR